MKSEQFEEWYSVNAFDFVANPIRSRDCGLQRKAYLAGVESKNAELDQANARIAQLEDVLNKVRDSAEEFRTNVMDKVDDTLAAQPNTWLSDHDKVTEVNILQKSVYCTVDQIRDMIDSRETDKS